MSWDYRWRFPKPEGRSHTFRIIDDPIKGLDFTELELRACAEHLQDLQQRSVTDLWDSARREYAKNVRTLLRFPPMKREDLMKAHIKETNMTTKQSKPKKERPLKSRASTETLLIKLLAAIKATYPTAPGVSSPGLVLSDVPQGQYGSICTYEPFTNKKTIVYKSYRATMREVLIDLSRQLVGAELSTARQELAKAVK